MNDKFEHAEIQTLPQVQDQETQMMQNLFQRAADTIVNASKLGKEVNELRAEMQKLLADTDRMREHITWLEQENQTLRSQRDEAQNLLSDTRAELDRWVKQHNNMEYVSKNLSVQLDSARQDATTWENLANETSQALQQAQNKIANLEDMLHAVWHGIKDHFKPEPKPEPTPAEIAPRADLSPSAYDPMNPTHDRHDEPKPSDYWGNPANHPSNHPAE